MQAVAAPASPADVAPVAPVAPVAAEDASEEETEVRRHLCIVGQSLTSTYCRGPPMLNVTTCM